MRKPEDIALGSPTVLLQMTLPRTHPEHMEAIEVDLDRRSCQPAPVMNLAQLSSDMRRSIVEIPREALQFSLFGSLRQCAE